MRIESIMIFSVLLLIGGVSAFTSTAATPSTARRSVARHSMSTPEEDRAAVLSNYLAKSHEEKLKAIKASEDKKNAEIQALKLQLAQAQELPASGPQALPADAGAAGAPVVKANVESMSKEELVAAVYAYQKFMGDYIVGAQQQKAKAIQEAVDAVEKKYKTKLEGGVATAPASAPAVETPKIQQVVLTSVEEPAVVDTGIGASATSLYDIRNAHVAASAAVGKSRWGGLELQRVAYLTADIRAPPPAPTATPPPAPTTTAIPQVETTYEVPPEVVAADHGLRNDGGVGGWTLAERIAMGATSPPMTTPPQQFIEPAPQEPSVALYRMRNLNVMAAARAGKSRWGDLEIQMAKQKAGGNPTRVAMEADHGLRANGSRSPDKGF